MSRFDELVRQLAAAKDHQTRLERAYQPHINSLKTAKDAVSLLDKSVRNEAMEEFLRHGDRTPHDAVEVKSVEKRVWDTEDNIHFALTNQPQILGIDAAKFKERIEGIAREMNASAVGGGDDVLFNLLVECLTLDGQGLSELVKEGQAPWATPLIVKEDVVHIRSRLGEYLIFNSPSEDSTEAEI